MVIVKAEANQIEKIVDMSVRAFETDGNVGGAKGDCPPGYDSVEWHQQMARQGHLYQAMIGKDLVGAAVIFPDETNNSVYIGRIWIDSIYHRKGYGIRLMECIEKEFSCAAEFHLDTPCWNERTNAFYKRLGYRIIKVEDGFVFYRKRNNEPNTMENNQVIFRNYTEQDYEAVCDFLIELNRSDNSHINWNWARFEWMAEHPDFDKSAVNSIGLWLDQDRIVGAAIYDMYFGEAFCGVLIGYESLYPAILGYAYRELGDEHGLGVSICDDNTAYIEAAEAQGFVKAEQAETVMSIELDGVLPVKLPDGYRFTELDPSREPYAFQWLLWQGFDHGTDRTAFEQAEEIIPQIRRHLDPRLSVTAADQNGEHAAYCCVWHHPRTDYAYVEPVCTVPGHRGKGLARAVIYEALNRAASLTATKAYVISDTAFYEKIGFHRERHFTFYWKG